MPLDPTLRARLRRLSEAEGQALPPSPTPAAIAARVQAAQAARRKRSLALGLGSFAAAAALGLLLWTRSSTPGTPTTAAHVEPTLPLSESHAGPDRGQSPAVVPAARAGACTRTVPQWSERADGQHTAELAREVRWVRSAGTRGDLSWEGGCDHLLQLHEGSVAVHARDLKRRALRVRVPLGEVRVVGTAFELRWEPDEGYLDLRVVEGTVEVALTDGPKLDVHAGERWQRRANGDSVRSPLRPHEARAVWHRLGVRREQRPPRRPASESSLATPAAQPAESAPAASPEPAEERIWRPGSSRVRPPGYQPQGSSLQPDGRPMRKPRVAP